MVTWSVRATLDKQILALAVPALATLLVQPALLLADSAIVGHWSTDGLAGLGLSQLILSTIVGLCIFLAYSTTASAARALGSGQLAKALKAGINAIWLGVLLGFAVGAITFIAADWLIGLFNAAEEVSKEAVVYLRISTFGLPAMLLIQAATGVVRGLQDTKTPLIISLAGAGLNIPLSIFLVHIARWGVAGAGLGTVICQLLMGTFFVVVIWRKANQHGVNLRFNISGVVNAWQDGVPLLVRTLSLKISLILLSLAALKLGTAQLAAHQIAWNIWGFLSNGLDSLAIAAQALVGKYLGANRKNLVRRLTSRLIMLAVILGTLAAGVLLVFSMILPEFFTPDTQVQSGLRSALLVIVIAQPLAGFVYVLDGVLMGAGDGRFLALVGVLNLIVFLPAIWLATQPGVQTATGLVGVWITWAGWYMAVRAIGLGLRTRSGAWLRGGANISTKRSART